jgi:hypothetical protein
VQTSARLYDSNNFYFLEITGKGFFERKNTLTVITNGSKGVFAKITACRQGAWG